MKKLLAWPSIAIVGATILGAIVLVVLFHEYRKRQDAQSAAAYYVEGCELRMKAINRRANSFQEIGRFAMPVEYSPHRCLCQAEMLLESFDPKLTRSVGDWFHFVSSAGNARRPNKAFFERIGFSRHQKLEEAYDLAAQQCYVLK